MYHVKCKFVLNYRKFSTLTSCYCYSTSHFSMVQAQSFMHICFIKVDNLHLLTTGIILRTIVYVEALKFLSDILLSKRCNHTAKFSHCHNVVVSDASVVWQKQLKLRSHSFHGKVPQCLKILCSLATTFNKIVLTSNQTVIDVWKLNVSDGGYYNYLPILSNLLKFLKYAFPLKFYSLTRSHKFIWFRMTLCIGQTVIIKLNL